MYDPSFYGDIMGCLNPQYDMLKYVNFMFRVLLLFWNICNSHQICESALNSTNSCFFLEFINNYRYIMGFTNQLSYHKPALDSIRSPFFLVKASFSCGFLAQHCWWFLGRTSGSRKESQGKRATLGDLALGPWESPVMASNTPSVGWWFSWNMTFIVVWLVVYSGL